MNNIEAILGRTLFQLWPELPKEVQEKIFEAMSCEPGVKRSIATTLHDHHPMTAHPIRPS
jgi:hypothetical protein